MPSVPALMVALLLASAGAGVAARVATQARDASFAASVVLSEKVNPIEKTWNNRTHVACDSGASAFAYTQALQRSALLVVRGFNFTVPPNATVVSIRAAWTVRITHPLSSVNRTYPHEVALVGPGTTGSPPTPRWNTPTPYGGSAAIRAWTSAWSVIAYPLAGEDAMWGVGAGGALATGAGVSSPLFGVAMSVDNLNIAAFDAQVACVRVEVNFTVADEPAATTAEPTTGAPAATTAEPTTGVSATTTTTAEPTTGAGVSAATTVAATTAPATAAVTTAPPAIDASAGDASTPAKISSWVIIAPALGFLGCFVLVAWATSRYLGWRKERALRFMRGIGLPASPAMSDDSESEPGSDLDGSFEMDEAVWLDDVAIGAEIGSGNFGSVYLGAWQKRVDVACKILTGDGVDTAAMEEAHRLSLLNHPNIVRFFGLYRAPRWGVFIIMEYLQKGALDAFLKTEEGRRLSDQDRLHVCTDVAAGMHYLSRKKVVHGDLSARNILVARADGAVTAKIADFGLSLLCDRGPDSGYAAEDGQYCRVPRATGRKVAIRHAAPETVEQGRYSSQSDVWSFGVVMWEIYSGGETPFAKMANVDVLKSVIDGERLARPIACPTAVYELMLQCWRLARVTRPRFSVICDSLPNRAQASGESFYNTLTDVVYQKDDGDDDEGEIIYQTM